MVEQSDCCMTNALNSTLYVYENSVCEQLISCLNKVQFAHENVWGSNRENLIPDAIQVHHG
jgi:hypothetical protein